MPSDQPSPSESREPEALTDDELDELVEDSVEVARRVPGGRLKTEIRPPTEKIVIERIVESIELKEDSPPLPKAPDGSPLGGKPDTPPVPGVLSRAGAGLLEIGLISAAGLPALVCAILVFVYAVDTPFGGDWERIDLLEKVHDGSATSGDFLSLEDGSRAPIPKAASVVIARVTGGNYAAALWLNIGGIAITAFGILVLLAKSFGTGARLVFGFFIANLILFSPHHHQQLLSASMLGPIIVGACLIWSVVFVTTSLPWVLRLVFCLICGAIGSFSHVAGLAIWPLMLALIFSIRNRGSLKNRIVFGVVWLVFSIAAIALWIREPAVAANFYAADVAGAAKTWFAVIAESLAPVWMMGEPNQLIILVGLALFCSFVSVIIFWFATTMMRGRMELWNVCLPWIGLGAGALLSALLVSLTSAQPFQASTAVFASPALLGLVILVVIFLSEGNKLAPESFLARNSNIVWAALLGLILAHQSALWFSGAREMSADRSARLQSHAALLLSPAIDPPGLDFDESNRFKARAEFLRSAGYRKLFPNARLDHLDLTREPLAPISMSEITTAGIHGTATLPISSRRSADAVVAVRTAGTPVILAAASLRGSAWNLEFSASEPADVWVIDIRTLRAWRTAYRLTSDGLGGVSVTEIQE
ncbi:MAG: hypothetical protein ACI8UO_006265 [Verrucomicrobiales bacterium]|jgi:hypothetical protein